VKANRNKIIKPNTIDSIRVNSINEVINNRHDKVDMNLNTINRNTHKIESPFHEPNRLISPKMKRTHTHHKQLDLDIITSRFNQQNMQTLTLAKSNLVMPILKLKNETTEVPVINIKKNEGN